MEKNGAEIAASIYTYRKTALIEPGIQLLKYPCFAEILMTERLQRDQQLDAQGIIETFGMVPHPEGGWYTETFRAPSGPGERSAATAIYFLLQQGQRSHWHTVDASEIRLWHAGSAIRLSLSHDGQQTETVLLGPDMAAGERLQAIVPLGVWQSAESLGAWSLVSCVVAPGFEFAGFKIAPPDWSPGSGKR